MAKQNKRPVFERKPEALQEFLQYLEDITKKDRGSALYEGYDVNPRAFRLPGRVVDPSGLGQDVYKEDTRFSRYEPTSIAFEAPQMGGQQVEQYDWQQPQLPEQQLPQFGQPEQLSQLTEQQVEPGSAREFQQLIEQVVAYPVMQSNDGGLVMSDGTIRYNDGTTRQATKQDIPRVVKELENGLVLLTDGSVINPNVTIGRGYQGVSGLSELLFGREQKVTQEYGNYNPNFYKSGYHSGVDFRTKDLDQNFSFALPFEVEVVDVVRAESGSPYGNSLLLRLPNGSMLRISHLSDMENVQPGTRVRAFDYLGTPGSTGLSTGEHLDVEYYKADGSRANPADFMFEAGDYVDYRQISESMQVDESQLSPESRAWVNAQRDLTSQGIEANPSPGMIQEYMARETQQAEPQETQQSQQAQQQNIPNQIASGIEKWNPTGQYGVGATELLRGDTEGARQELGQTAEGLAEKAGINTELGVGEMIRGEDPVQARISALSRQPKVPAEDRGLWGKTRQLLGNVSERVGDFLGIPEGSISETIAGGATKRTNQALANQIGGETPEQVPGIRQNIADIGQDLSQKAQGFIGQAGEGVEKLKSEGKDIAQGLFQKTPIMSLFEGQKAIGDTKGSTKFEGTAKVPQADTRDAFFKYGGADQFAKYLIDNAQEKKGGALGTDLFSREFYQDPNRVANVFGETSMGGEATGKYKDYLGSNIKEGFDEPYRTEIREEGDNLMEYKIPIREYFENKYWQEQKDKTPDILQSGFGYDQFQMPTTQRTERFGGEIPTSNLPAVFKSGAVDLFKKAGSEVARKVGDITKPIADVYKSSVPSGQIDIPSAFKSIFGTPSSKDISAPSQTSRVIGLTPAAQERQEEEQKAQTRQQTPGWVQNVHFYINEFGNEVPIGGSVKPGTSSGTYDTRQLDQRDTSPSVQSATPVEQAAQQYAQRATQPTQLSSWSKPPVTQQQQSRADIRNPAIYKSTQDWVRLLMQGAGR